MSTVFGACAMRAVSQDAPSALNPLGFFKQMHDDYRHLVWGFLAGTTVGILGGLIGLGVGLKLLSADTKA